jgi:hypothetical protein
LATTVGGALRDWCARRGAVLIEHRIAGVDGAEPAADAVLWDLGDVLLGGAWDTLSAPPGAVFLWPLLGGLTDGADLVASGLARLVSLGAETVVPLVPRLSPGAGRRLAERLGGGAFEAIFHGPEVEPRAFAAACRAHGIDFLPRRFLPRGTAPALRPLERRIAAELALLGDLSLELGASEVRAQDYFRAARWFESSHHDTRGLVRDGNLDVVPWLDEEMAAVVVDLAAGARRSRRLEEQARVYAGG